MFNNSQPPFPTGSPSPAASNYSNFRKKFKINKENVGLDQDHSKTLPLNNLKSKEHVMMSSTSGTVFYFPRTPVFQHFMFRNHPYPFPYITKIKYLP